MSIHKTARQLVDAINELVEYVENCREQVRAHEAARPNDRFDLEDLFRLLLPIKDMKVLEMLDAEVYGLAVAVGLTILLPANRPAIHMMGYTGIRILQTRYIPPLDSEKSDVILATGIDFEVSEWDARMAALLTAAELLASGGVKTDGPNTASEFHWKRKVCKGLSKLEFQFLTYMFNEGEKRQSATFEELRERVWGDDVKDKTIGVFTSRLNTKLNAQDIYIGLTTKNYAAICTWE